MQVLIFNFLLYYVVNFRFARTFKLVIFEVFKLKQNFARTSVGIIRKVNCYQVI